jgi:hypothetical protein
MWNQFGHLFDTMNSNSLFIHKTQAQPHWKMVVKIILSMFPLFIFASTTL